MTTFVIAVLCVAVLAAIGELTILSGEQLPVRKRAYIAVDLIFSIIFIVWSVVLLT